MTRRASTKNVETLALNIQTHVPLMLSAMSECTVLYARAEMVSPAMLKVFAMKVRNIIFSKLEEMFNTKFCFSWMSF